MNECGELCRCRTETISETDDCIVKQYTGENGQYLMTTYRIFPGVEFMYGDAHIQSVCFDEKIRSHRVFEITHCREGRLECSLNGEFWYLSQGDLMIAKADLVAPSVYFPLRHYHGLTIRIDLDKTPKCLSCILDDVMVRPKAIADKFCGNKGGYVARANASFEHIFSELYSVPVNIRKGYYKIKALELLLFLSEMDLDNDELSERIYTKTQVTLAKEIGRYLTEHIDDRITIEQLAEHFHVSAAHIKNTFKGVYGVSVGSFIRTRKMESAAYMLEYTDKTILEIAGEHGYDNGSKFANAFRSVKGINPAEYRNTYCRKRNKV